MTVRRIAQLALLFSTALCACLAQTRQDDSAALLGFLNQSIYWYRHVQLPGQLSTDPVDASYTAYNRSASVQAISLIFDFAREQAQQIQLDHASDSPASSGGAQPGRNLPQLVVSMQQRVRQAAADLDALQQQAAATTGKKHQTFDAQIAEQKSELELAEARLETLQNMSAFAVAGASAGLLGKINELERTVPETRSAIRSVHSLHPDSNRAAAGSTAAGNNAGDNSAAGAASSSNPSAAISPLAMAPVAAAPAPVAATSVKEPGDGLIARSGRLFSLIRKLNAQRDAIDATAALRSSLDRIRDPLRKQLRDVNQRGDDLSAQPQSNDPAVLADRRKQIDALTADFKHLSAIVLPLAKASILLDATANNLAEWRGESQRAYSAQGRALLLRIGALLLTILLIAIAADFWRRAIFRYIREQRRRNQFLLLRRILVTAVIVLVLIFSLSTEIGSLATFAGFLTAGIAIALQNVILSVAAYFLLIGRYGIRVGDRVQIGEVTGDVFNIGLVRLYLVELDTSGSEPRPTGRIVVFSNSVVFQPASNFFKQLPGSNFAWRRLSLTLAPDVDYELAERCISTAVARVYETYKTELDRQHRTLESSLAIHIGSTEPRTRLRLHETGLEIVILYPVVLTQAAEIDDRMTHALLDTIEGEPRLHLVGGSLTNIQPVDATPKPAIQAH